MSGDSTAELLTAIRTRLLADAALSAIVGIRVFDMPPQTIVYPYVQMGDVQSNVFEDGACIDGSELFLDFHTWARGQQPATQMHGMNKAIRDSLHGQRFTVAGHTLQAIEHQTTRTLRDPDGITRHGVVTFRAFTTAA